MKKILIFAILMNFLALYAEDKIDVRKKPEPLEKSKFIFPEYKEFTMDNGLKVFVIEDHEQPTISFRMSFAGGTSMDLGKNGLTEMTAALLDRGAGERDALTIAKLLDGVGASISANAGPDNISVSANSLKKHMKLLLELYSEMITNPTFNEDEFDKLIPQFISSIKESKSNGGQLAAALSRKVLYGDNHPYAAKQTEESIKELKIKDVKNYHEKYFIPNNATLAVVGDVTVDEIRPMLEKAFKKWKSGDDVKISLPQIQSLPLGVYFVNRPGSVQSSINIATKAVPYSHSDYETIDIASSVIGSGFAGRLFRTLRETYSYTYTPFGNISSSKYINRFQCGAEVRNSVTDSAIDVTLEQLRLLATQAPGDEELERIKKFEVGNFLTSFENSSFIAALVQNADFHNISMQSVKTYPDRILALSPNEIQRVASEYMNPRKAYIIVVGSAEVKEKLAKFGKVFEYDLDLNPLTGEKAKLEKAGVDADELLEKYTKAIGGKENIEKIKSMMIEAKAEMTVQGRNFKGSMVQKLKAPNKMLMNMDMGIFKSMVWVNGIDAYTGNNDETTKQEGVEAEKLLISSKLFKELKLKESGYKLEVLGKLGNEIIMKAIGKLNNEITYYFDAKSFLINKVETLENLPQGPTPVTEVFSDYSLVDGLVLMAKKVENNNPMFTITMTNTYTLNPAIDDAEFEVKK